MRTASIVRGGRTERVERSLMMALARRRGDRARQRQGAPAAALVTGLRVTVWATARKGGSLVATRVRIEDAD